MRVVPECSRLTLCIKFMKERSVLSDGALRDERCTISIICTILIDPVPMLEKSVSIASLIELLSTYHAGAQPHVRIF